MWKLNFKIKFTMKTFLFKHWYFQKDVFGCKCGRRSSFCTRSRKLRLNILLRFYSTKIEIVVESTSKRKIRRSWNEQKKRKESSHSELFFNACGCAFTCLTVCSVRPVYMCSVQLIAFQLKMAFVKLLLTWKYTLTQFVAAWEWAKIYLDVVWLGDHVR